MYTELFVSNRTIDKSSDVSNGGGERGSPEKRQIDISRGTNRYVRLP